MRKVNALFFAAAAVFVFSDMAAAASSKDVRKVKGGYCLAANAKGTKFVPALKSGSSYLKMASSNSKYKSLKKTCAALLSAKTLKFGNLPSTADILVKEGSTQQVGAQAVSGTAPTLIELGSTDATGVYYVPGVLDRLLAGTPTDSDCSQIFTSSVDGDSGGMSACRSAQDVGESMGNVLQSETTVCYMKNFPGAVAADSNVADLVSGSLPTGGWRALFDTPSSSDRLVKVTVTGFSQPESVGASAASSPTMYIKVKSADSNLAGGYQYRAEFYSCEGNAVPQEAQSISINNSNAYVIKSVGHDGESSTFSTSVNGKLIADAGDLVFDPSAARRADTVYVNEGSNMAFKSRISIEDGVITTKRYGTVGAEVSKNFSAAHYSGEDMANLKFTDGAFKDYFSGEHGEFAFDGGVEYRDSGYRAAPAAELTSALPADFSDSFYSGTPTAPADTSFNCNTADPDVVIRLDMASDRMQAIAATCEGVRFQSHNFCETETMSQVQQAFFNYCNPH